jgi:hypothetical protein
MLPILHGRVARWFVFKPKIPLWVNFGGPYIDWKNGYIFEISGIFYRRLGYFMTIWYILCSFVTFFPFWYYGREKSGNPAT